MTSASKKFRVAAVAGLHVHKSHQQDYRKMFASISEQADVVALCGDLTNLGLPEEATNLARDLSVLRIPIVAVLGNHDYQHGQPDAVKNVLRDIGVTFLE